MYRKPSVVPANAGTHTPRPIDRGGWSCLFVATAHACGYGSLRSQGRRWLCRSTLRGELRRLVLRGQRIDELAQRFARNHLRQLVERQIDAVVGDAALREIIGADALAAVAGADLFLAVGGARRFLALPLGVVDARAQD